MHLQLEKVSALCLSPFVACEHCDFQRHQVLVLQVSSDQTAFDSPDRARLLVPYAQSVVSRSFCMPPTLLSLERAGAPLYRSQHTHQITS